MKLLAMERDCLPAYLNLKRMCGTLTNRGPGAMTSTTSSTILGAIARTIPDLRLDIAKEHDQASNHFGSSACDGTTGTQTACRNSIDDVSDLGHVIWARLFFQLQ